jgi:hypothetical protein
MADQEGNLFLSVTPWSLVGRYRHFGGTQSHRIPLKRR